MLHVVRSHGAPKYGSFLILSALFQVIDYQVVMFWKPLMMLFSVKYGVRVLRVANPIIVDVHDWVCVVGQQLVLRNLRFLIIYDRLLHGSCCWHQWGHCSVNCSVVVRAQATECLTCLPKVETRPKRAQANILLRLPCCLLHYLGRECDIIRIIKKSLLLFLPVV